MERTYKKTKILPKIPQFTIAQGRCGFTLLELSIILVVIGLVISAIVVGTSFLKNADLRSQIGQLDKMSAAIDTFEAKYDCLPGDCANATEWFPNGRMFDGTPLTNGNGNGFIDVWPDETLYNAPAELVAAGLVPVKYVLNSGYFKGPNDSRSYLYYKDLYAAYDNYNTGTKSGLTISWGKATGDGSGCVMGAVISPIDAVNIDSKIDDGLPNAGIVLGIDPLNSAVNCVAPPQIADQALTCRDAATHSVYQNSEVIGCRMVYYRPGK